MENLLIRYLKYYTNSDYISIDYYNVDGATCYVEYYVDGSEYKESDCINIWNVIAFLNDN